MKIKYWLNESDIVAGITFADMSMPEQGNMALHVCQNREHVLENRRILAEELGCELRDFVCSNQTHSANFFKVEASDRGRGALATDSAIADTDALYTFERGLLLCCFTADCVPVILYDDKKGLTGIIHSGWQGTVKEITPKLLDRLLREEHCDPKNLSVFIGASLSAARFEVDADVSEQFSRLGYADDLIYWNSNTGKYHIDNQLVVSRQCQRAGISPEQIALDRTCTFESPDCFSYRRDKASGRQMSFVMRRK